MRKIKHKHGFHHEINAQVRKLEIAFGVYGNNNRRKMHGEPLERYRNFAKAWERRRRYESRDQQS